LGCWFGVAVRLHPTMIVLAVIAALWSSSTAVLAAAGSMTWITLMTLGLLMASVLAHQLAHFVVARRFGAPVSRIVLSPVGDISDSFEFSIPSRTLFWAVAGPMVNLLICVICFLVLLLLEPTTRWGVLFHPLYPAWEPTSGLTITQVVKIALWINWGLLLINCVPALPFDAGHALRGLLAMIPPANGTSRAADVMFGVGMVSAIVLLIAAALEGRAQSDVLFPTWWGMILLAVVILIDTVREVRRRDAQAATAAVDHHSNDSVSASESHALVHAVGDQATIQSGVDWDVVSERSRGDQQEEDRLLDEVLRRVHACGMASLTDADRALLERVSKRYRQRLHRP